MCKKTVYWDLINSNVNKRDVQTVVQGIVHKAALFENMRIIFMLFVFISTCVP